MPVPYRRMLNLKELSFFFFFNQNRQRNKGKKFPFDRFECNINEWHIYTYLIASYASVVYIECTPISSFSHRSISWKPLHKSMVLSWPQGFHHCIRRQRMWPINHYRLGRIQISSYWLNYGIESTRDINIYNGFYSICNYENMKIFDFSCVYLSLTLKILRNHSPVQLCNIKKCYLLFF